MCPQGIFTNIGRYHFSLSHPRGGVLLVSSRERPGLLLNFLQCRGHPPTAKNDLIPKVSSANIKKSWSKDLEEADTTDGRCLGP